MGRRLLVTLLLLACAHAREPEPRPPAAEPSPAPSPRVDPASGPAVAVEPAPSAPKGPPDVETLLSTMSLEAKVGQMMMVGFGGTVVDAPVEALVRGKLVGGVCMFKRNLADADQVGHLNDAVRALLADSIPPFIAVDQEGG